MKNRKTLGYPVFLFFIFSFFLFVLGCCCRKSSKSGPVAQPTHAPIQVQSQKPEGTIVDGLRVLKKSANSLPEQLFVYRGDVVKLLIEDLVGPATITMPDFNLTKEINTGELLELEFKAATIGTYPVFLHTEKATPLTQIVVIQYESLGKARFSELTAEEAKELIEQKKPFILDVRTKGEYGSGYIENAVLIPVHELEKRIGELEPYKDKDVLVYCRSGNRSTVASQILIDKGFTALYNLRPGIRGWLSKGYPLSKK